MTDNVDDEFDKIVNSQLSDLEEKTLHNLSAEQLPTVQSVPPQRITYELTSPRSWTPGPEVDDFVPPPPLPPAKALSSMALFGVVSIIGGILLLGGAAIKMLSTYWAIPMGFALLCGGIIILFTRLPRDRNYDPEDGAKV